MSYNSSTMSLLTHHDGVIREAIAILEYRYNQLSVHPKFTTPTLVKDYLRLKMAAYEREVFAVLHRLISCEELFFGTIDAASVYPREVVKLVLHRNAAAVIFAHNHPSNMPEPSEADKRITERLKTALATIDVSALDHFVVGHQDVVSFAERGWL